MLKFYMHENKELSKTHTQYYGIIKNKHIRDVEYRGRSELKIFLYDTTVMDTYH